MADLDELIREWTDQANQGVDPVELDAVLARAPMVGAASVGPSRRTRVLAGLTAAALVLAAVVAVSTLARADGEHRVATEPDAPPAHVPSAYDLFPPGAKATIEQPRPATGNAWRESFGIDIEAVEQMLRWRGPDGRWLVVVVGGDRVIGYTDPGVSVIDHRGVRVVSWEGPRSPFGSSGASADVPLGEVLIIGSDVRVLTDALDRHLDETASLGRSSGMAKLLPHVTELVEGEVHSPPADVERWYTAFAVGRLPSGATTFTFAVAGDRDPESVADALADVVVPPGTGDDRAQRPAAQGEVAVDGSTIRVTVDVPAGRDRTSTIRDELLIAGGKHGDGSMWTWIVGGAVLLLVLAGVTWRSHVRDVEGNVDVQVAMMRTGFQNQSETGGFGGFGST